MYRMNEPPDADGKSIHRRTVFEKLLFAQCWEDPELDRRALELPPGGTALVVTSGGCTALSLALESPSRLIAVDMNPTQTALLELKIAGARRLDHGEYLELLGVRSSSRRAALYRACRPGLSADAAPYWDANERSIERGVLRSGRYEQYLEAFRRLLLVIQGPRRIRRLFEMETEEERRRFYRDEWDRAGWRLFFRLFFSRALLGRFGLDPAFFTYVDGGASFGEHFRRLAEHVLTDIPARENYFLAQICLGRYLNEAAVPPYLQAGHFERLRRHAGRIEPCTGELEAVLRSLPDGSIDAFALSNVFEWVSPDVFERTLREIHRTAAPGGRLCYRNLLVRRTHPRSLDGWFLPEPVRARRLLFEDRSFVYSRFEIATALPAPRGEVRHANDRVAVAVPDSRLDPGRPGLRHDRGPADR